MKIKNILFAIAISLTFFSCNSLDVDPTGSLVINQFYKTESDATAGVTAVYASLTYDDDGDQPLYGRNLYFLTDMGSDYATAGASAINPNVRAISSLSYDASNDRVALAWKQIYRGIDRANVAIDNIPNVTASDTILKTRLINEAKFIRALLYFDAVQLWGPVPLVLHEAESLNTNILKTNRVGVDTIYSQIISDLTDAENLPSSYTSSNIGRATSGAAKSLLAKVYLVRKDWGNAQKYAEEVINGGYGYALFDDYSKAFLPQYKNGKEHIFSAQFTDGQNGTSGSSGNILPGCSFNGFVATEPADIISDKTLFYDIYDTNDTRKYVNYMTKLYNPSTGSYYTFTVKPRFRKYIDSTLIGTSSQSAAETNFPIIRYADILLTLAEAINEQSTPTTEAYEAINEVRRRAFGKDIQTANSTIDLHDLSQSDFRTALHKERLLEFVQEGQRWFDLVRWGTLVSEVSKVSTKSSVSTRNNLYPIPQTQHDINPTGLWQNPNY